MSMRRVNRWGLLVALSLAGGCEVAHLPPGADMGPAPRLAQPRRGLIPTVNTAPAVGWPAGATPVAAPGLRVMAFATGLEHPRWLYRLPNGDVLVAETNGPPRTGGGFVAWAMRRIMGRAGAGVASPNRIVLLRDADGDGVAETRATFAAGLNSPFGMALVGERLFIANTDAIVELHYAPGATQADGAPRRLVELPANAPNGHWARNLIAGADGRQLYVTVGSATNVADGGLEAERDRAAIHEVDLATGVRRPFATGLRNANGLAWEPRSGALWTVVNERDELGSDLVPDYLTRVENGAFYGWPWSWYGAHVDARVKPQEPAKVAAARVPDYALGAHTASLGLAFVDAGVLAGRLGESAVIGQHGSWNRRPPSGYKVIAVPFRDGQPDGLPRDVLTGFLNARGEAQGRPVGVIQDGRGNLLVADDVGNVIWRVSPE
jgi:glucose/arabinose dehydrogenase